MTTTPAPASQPNLYRKTALVQAEQFLPAEGKIPAGVISDGHGDPRIDARFSFVLQTLEGVHQLRDGDYICTGPKGEKWNVERSIFESTYEPIEQPSPARSDKDAERAKAMYATWQHAQPNRSSIPPWDKATDSARAEWLERAAQESAPSSEGIDGKEFDRLLNDYADNPNGNTTNALIDFVNAWGVEQKRAGRAYQKKVDDKLLARRATAGTTAAPIEPDAYMVELASGECIAVNFQQFNAVAKLREWKGKGKIVPLFRERATAGNAAPTEAVYQVLLDGSAEDFTTWLDIKASDADTWRKKGYKVRILASNTATAAPGDLPPLPETLGIVDVPHATNTPADWDADYRATWQKLQVADANLRQWRAYARDLRACIASDAGAAPGEAETHEDRCRLIRDFGDANLIADVQAGRISISAAVEKVRRAAPSNPPAGATQEQTK
jgi:hypothetical protein